MAKKYENIENIGKMLSGGTIGELSRKVTSAEKTAYEVLKKLSDLDNAQTAKRVEEEKLAQEKKAAEDAKIKAAEEAKKLAEQKAAEQKAAEDAKKLAEQKAAEEAKLKAAQEKAEKEKQEQLAKQEEEKAKQAAAAKIAKEEKQPQEKPQERQNTQYSQNKPQQANQQASGQTYVKRENSQYNRDNNRDNNQYNNRQNGFGDRRNQDGNRGDKTFVNRDRTDRGDRGDRNQQNGTRPPRTQQGTGFNSARPQQGGYNSSRPQQGGFNSSRPQQGGYNSTRPQQGGNAQRFAASAVAAPATKPATKNFGQDKKKPFEKTYVEKEKHTISKRALAKQQGASIDDFDEDKSGYRKLRVKKDKKQLSSQTIKIEKAVVTTNEIPLKVLSEKLGISAVEITKKLFKEGIMKTVNESIDYDTAALVAAEMGIELEYKPEKTAEEILSENAADTVEEIENLVPRAPVVTVMGHVDHGKTSLLDYIRKTNATAGEAGGITQHIGAYSVNVNGKMITFIDTPGHEAFTAMRARGAQVTDIVILVVAADDGIMPQTIEAINHAKAAGVSIIVAANKMDKVGANLDKLKQDLTNYDLTPEEWGGTTPVCPISCKTGEGIDNLLEAVLITAEMKELLANPAREARGAIIEAQLDKGKGPVATVLIQNGTLRTGDNIISGTITGRVRAMIDDKGRTVKEAGPSMAVYVLGFEEVPNAGDSMFAVSQDLMKQVLDERKRKESDAMVKSAAKISLDDAFGKIAEGNMKSLNLIIKGDVQGSVEAIKSSVVKLSNDEVQVKVIHSGAGAITESDVMLADSSNAIILGFNVRPDVKAKATAERSKVDIRTYRIIYDLLDDIEAALKGMLAPKYQEVYLGKCEVRQTFKITGVGNIAGCYVKDGKIVRGGKLRIYRDDVLVVEGNVQQLKRFKDDVKEVAYGYECGCAIEGFNDIRVGDIIECYMIEQIPAK
jgi:translation initiation factor IF-2